MQLLTKELKKKLIRNGETRNDPFPVVKFFDGYRPRKLILFYLCFTYVLPMFYKCK